MKKKHSYLCPGGVTACILAGGRGSRLGGIDKGLAVLDKKYLIEHCIERIAPQVDHILISANRNIETYSSLCEKVVSDTYGTFAGPLAGFLSGMVSANTRYLVTLPCDSPFIPHNLVSALSDPVVNHNADASVAITNGKSQPTFSFLTVSQHNSLEQYLLSGNRKIITWLEGLGLEKVNFEEHLAFMNINTPEDLDIATRRLNDETNI